MTTNQLIDSIELSMSFPLLAPYFEKEKVEKSREQPLPRTLMFVLISLSPSMFVDLKPAVISEEKYSKRF